MFCELLDVVGMSNSCGGEVTTSKGMAEVDIWFMTVGISLTDVDILVVPTVDPIGCSPKFGVLLWGRVGFFQVETFQEFLYHSSNAYMFSTHNFMYGELINSSMQGIIFLQNFKVIRTKGFHWTC